MIPPYRVEWGAYEGRWLQLFLSTPAEGHQQDMIAGCVLCRSPVIHPSPSHLQNHPSRKGCIAFRRPPLPCLAPSSPHPACHGTMQPFLPRRVPACPPSPPTDCYIAATGLMQKDPNHAELMLKFALALRSEARKVIGGGGDDWNASYTRTWTIGAARRCLTSAFPLTFLQP